MTTIDPNVVDTLLAQGLRERSADLGDEDWFYEQVLTTAVLLPQRRSLVGWPAWSGRRTILVLVAVALVGLIVASLVAGGILRRPAPPIPGFWTATGGMIHGHSYHTATLLPDGTVLVVGGGPDPQPDSAELYDPGTEAWIATGAMTAGRGGHTATLLLDGRVLVAGGYGPNDAVLASADVYDPSTRSWTATPNMIDARFGHSATLLPDGRVLVAGGADRTAELYDPRSGTWTVTGNMVTGHVAHTATLLADGTVLVAGGDADARPAELYDPRTGTWRATGSMIQGRWDYTATLLPDGTVLGAGTEGGRTGMTAELYDPRTGTWRATGSMIQDHWQSEGTLLLDGTVLVTGGIGGIVVGDDPASASVELYDPSRGTWSAAPNMDAERRLHTSTLLPDGTVLVTGGLGDTGAATSAELYHPGGVP